jgi:hypothetical protein
MSSSFAISSRFSTACAPILLAVILTWSFISSAAAQPPPPGQFDVRVVTRDRAFPNIELGGRVWAGSPPTYGQMVAAEHTFRLPAGQTLITLATPTAVSPAGCDYVPEQDTLTINVDRSMVLPLFFKCREDNTTACHRGPDDIKVLEKLVDARLEQYQAAVKSYGGLDFRSVEARREFLCYRLDLTNRLRQSGR